MAGTGIWLHGGNLVSAVLQRLEKERRVSEKKRE